MIGASVSFLASFEELPPLEMDCLKACWDLGGTNRWLRRLVQGGAKGERATGTLPVGVLSLRCMKYEVGDD